MSAPIWKGTRFESRFLSEKSEERLSCLSLGRDHPYWDSKLPKPYSLLWDNIKFRGLLTDFPSCESLDGQCPDNGLPASSSVEFLLLRRR